jgi:hypothetical protein
VDPSVENHPAARLLSRRHLLQGAVAAAFSLGALSCSRDAGNEGDEPLIVGACP